MPNLCEVTHKKYRRNGMPADRGKKTEKGKPLVLKRKLDVKEIKGTVRLNISEEGLEIVKKAGGIAKFLKEQDEKKLSGKMLKLKRKIYGEPEPKKPAEEEKPAEEKVATAPAEAKPAEEKAAEAPAEEKPAEKKAAEAPVEDKPAEEKREAKAEAPPAESEKPAEEAKPAEEKKQAPPPEGEGS